MVIIIDNQIIILGGLPTATKIIKKNIRSVNFHSNNHSKTVLLLHSFFTLTGAQSPTIMSLFNLIDLRVLRPLLSSLIV